MTLIDLPDNFRRSEHGISAILHAAGLWEVPFERLAQGVYNSGVNFGNDLEEVGYEINRYPFMDEISSLRRIGEEWGAAFDELPHDYGVCDSYEQILAKWPMIETDKRKFLISMALITKEGTPDWRWHKWGDYIGTYEPQHEYIRDEDIDQVWVYHIIEILDTP